MSRFSLHSNEYPMPPSIQTDITLPIIADCLSTWAEVIVLRHSAEGSPLGPREMAWAENRGILSPERVRVIVTKTLPFPDDTQVKLLGAELDLIDERVAALTLGYMIFSKARPSDRILKHELRHVQQYEALGGVRGFLTRYVGELLAFGYSNAPLEVDARNHEILAGD